MIKLRADLLKPLEAGGVEGIQQSLQLALQLEHSTIPPYLYAWYSIKSGTNDASATIIHDVFVEEMFHLAIVSNLLNAYGQAPVFGTEAVTPTYPGPLVGGVDTGLIVTLAPCSVAQVQNVFMGIEEPEDPQNFPVENFVDDDSITIGTFYRAIQTAIQSLPSDPISPTLPQLGKGTFHGLDLPQVTDAAAAIAAIELIVDQGEGTTDTSPQAPSGGGIEEIAHYYRFEQIVKGGTLRQQDDGSWFFDTSAPFAIVLDTTTIAQAPTNPHAADYPAGSPERNTIDGFNEAYTKMLQTLASAFVTGSADSINSAVGAMFGLTSLAQDMMFPSGASTTVLGPTFEWLSS